MAERSSVPVIEIKNEFVTCDICMECYNNGNKSLTQLPCHHSVAVSVWLHSGVTLRKVQPAIKRMNEYLTTPQHKTRSAIGCQNKVDA